MKRILDAEPLGLDPLFEDAARIVVERQDFSISYLQRVLVTDYKRTCEIAKDLESAGIIGSVVEPMIPQEVLIHGEESLDKALIEYGKSYKKIPMLGAIVGDIVGSPYEFYNTKSPSFELFTPQSYFTDDSVMTLAVAKWLIEDEAHTIHYLIYCMQELGNRYPRAGYGGNFMDWLRMDEPQPYNSWGNGAGMRVSPVGLYANTLDEALALAALTASVSHNHPEGVKGAQAIATSVFLCKEGKSKQEIKEYVEKIFDYNLNRRIADIRPTYDFDVSCQGSVPEAIIAFLEGNSFEEVIRLAISLGGDSDTIGAMAGAIAACMYPIPRDIAERCDSILTDDLREIKDLFVDLVIMREREKRWEKIYWQEEYDRSLKEKTFYNRVIEPILRRFGLSGGIVD